MHLINDLDDDDEGEDCSTDRTMKSECASVMMCFSERMCSCCLVSTMWRFFRIFMANVFASSFFSCTWRQTCSQFYLRGKHPLFFCSSTNIVFTLRAAAENSPQQNHFKHETEYLWAFLKLTASVGTNGLRHIRAWGLLIITKIE